MIRELLNITKGKYIWKRLRNKYHIDDSTVVIVLPESNNVWNKVAIKYLPDYLKRKNCYKAVLLYSNNTNLEDVLTNEETNSVFCIKINDNCIKNMMSYYCFHRFFDKIIFFYLDYPYDNNSSNILKTTNVTTEELVCLGFYQLREVPSHV